MPRCCVEGCKSYSAAWYCNYKFYRFPNRPWQKDRKLEWIKFVDRRKKDGSMWFPDKDSRVCSAHFIGNEKSEHPADPSFNPTIKTGQNVRPRYLIPQNSQPNKSELQSSQPQISQPKISQPESSQPYTTPIQLKFLRPKPEVTETKWTQETGHTEKVTKPQVTKREWTQDTVPTEELSQDRMRKTKKPKTTVLNAEALDQDSATNKQPKNTDDLVTINCPNHHEQLIDRLWCALQSRRAVDFYLLVGRRSIGVHRFLLDLFLSYDQLYQTSGALQEELDDGSVLDSLLQFLYTGQLTIARHQIDLLRRVATAANFGLLLDCMQQAKLGEESSGGPSTICEPDIESSGGPSTVCEPDIEGVFMNAEFEKECVLPRKSSTNHSCKELAAKNQVLSNPLNKSTTQMCEATAPVSKDARVMSEWPPACVVKVEPESSSDNDDDHDGTNPFSVEGADTNHFEFIPKLEPVNESGLSTPIPNLLNSKTLNKQSTKEVQKPSDMPPEDILKTAQLTMYTVQTEPSIDSASAGFDCPFCGQLFIVQEDLFMHAAEHANESPKKRTEKSVEVGGYSLPGLSGLSDGPPFNCHLCKKSFTQRGRLRNHIFKVHKFESKVVAITDDSSQLPTNIFQPPDKQNYPPDQNKMDLPAGMETSISNDM